MTTRWYIAKFVPDLRRFEPRNVGVIVFAPDGAACRFLGEGEDARVDGRIVRWVVPDVEGYRAWVDAWRYWVDHPSADRDQALLQRRPGDQFYLQDAGERLFGEITSESTLDAEELARRLFADLVERPGTSGGEEGEEAARLKGGDVWRALTRRWAKPDLAEKFAAKVIESKFNRERFDYVHTNGLDHVVHPLSLDLSSAMSIRHTGTAWGGRIRALRPDPETLKIDVVLGMPPLAAGERREAAEEASAFLAEDLDREGIARVIREADVSTYAAELEREVSAPEQG